MGDERPFRFERQHRRGLPEVDPAHLVELVVMALEVAADGFHHEVVHRLVDARAGLDEPVFDVLEGPRDADLQAGLLADLTQGGLLGALTALGRALGERPRPTIALTLATADDELRSPGLIPDDDAAGGRGGRGPQACHGAVAARGRRPGPDRAARAQCISTSGRSRAFRIRGRAGRGPRQPARRRAYGPASDPRSSVWRAATAENDEVGTRPSRRSRARLDGRTKRAAGRAAYLAAMLCPMGRNGSASVRPCKG